VRPPAVAGFPGDGLAAIERFLGCSLDEYDVYPQPKNALLVIRAPRAPFWSQPPFFVLLIIWAPFAMTVGALAWRRTPWPSAIDLSTPWGILLAFLAGGAPLALLAAWAARRSGGVEFYEKYIFIHEKFVSDVASHAGKRVSWQELRAYRDDRSEYVQLLR
jgi:hypothetical protein